MFFRPRSPGADPAIGPAHPVRKIQNTALMKLWAGYLGNRAACLALAAGEKGFQDFRPIPGLKYRGAGAPALPLLLALPNPAGTNCNISLLSTLTLTTPPSTTTTRYPTR